MALDNPGLAAQAVPTNIEEDVNYGDFVLKPEEAKRLADFLHDELTRAENDTRVFRESVTLWREFVDPKEREKDFPWPKASNIFVPIPRTILDALKASVKQTISKQKEKFTAEINSAEEAGLEDEKEVFRAQRAAVNFAEKISTEPGFLELPKVIDEWVEEMLVTGIGVVKLIDDTDSRNVKTKGGVERLVVRHNGPNLFVVPTGTFVWPPGLWRSIQEMPWAGDWVQHTAAGLRVRARAPWHYQNVEEVVKEDAGNIRDADSIKRLEAIGQSADGIKTYEVSLIWSFDDDDVADPFFHDLSVTYNLASNRLHRVIYNQAGDGRKPYDYEVASPRAGTIFGRGIIEPIAQPCRGINTGVNQTFDSQTLANAPSVLYPEDSAAAEILSDGYFPGMPLPYKEQKDEIGILQFPAPSATSFQLVAFFMQVIERLTRIGPSRLGEVSEGRRTPASLGLATQQIGAELIDELIDRLRETMGRVVGRAFIMYLETDPGVFVRLLGEEDGTLLKRVVTASRDNRTSTAEGLRLRLAASSATRSVELERQNAMATAQLLFGWYRQSIELVQMFLRPVDPNTGLPIPEEARKILLDVLKSSQEQMKRLVELADQPDSATLVPDLAAQLEPLLSPSTEGGPAGTPTAGGPSSQGADVASLLTGQALSGQ